VQWRHHTRACQGKCKCPGRNTSALAVKSGSNKIIYLDILIVLADAADDLSMLCHEQWIGAATDPMQGMKLKSPSQPFQGWERDF